MHEVTVRDIPARTLLSLIRRLHEGDLIPMGRELFIHRLAHGGVPRIERIAGAPFTIFHGEVSGDSDGPVEWCWLALSRAVVRTRCGPSRPGGTGLGRALNTGS